MANVSSSNGIEKYPKLRFPEFTEPWNDTVFDTFIQMHDEKVFGEHSYEVLTSSREGLQRQSDHFGTEQRHDTDGYNIIPLGYCTYRNRSDDGIFTFNVNNAFHNGIVSKFYPVFKFVGANSTFMTEYLNNSISNKKKLSILAVGTSQVVLSISALRSSSFCIPHEKEQDKLASFIELLNTRIVIQRQLVEHLKKYKRGVINRLINNLMKHSTTHDFKELVSIQRGGSPRPIDEYITDDPNGINWIKIGDVAVDSLYITKTKERIKPSGAGKSRKVRPGDLILSNSMSFGRPYIMKIGGCIHDGWLLIRDDNEKYDKKFLCYYLASDNVLSQYRRFAAGSCVSNLNSDLVGNLQVVLPSMEQQKKCAEIFEQIDARVFNAIRQYECLCQLKQGLLQQLFI